MKTRSSVFLIIIIGQGFYQNVPHLTDTQTQTHFSHTDPHPFALHAARLTPTPPSLARFLRFALRSTPW